jgi:hypothetical protein
VLVITCALQDGVHTVQFINGLASTMGVLPFVLVLTGMKKIKNIVDIGTILVMAM